MSVRRVVTRSGLHVRGYFPSYKTGRMVSWESQLERKCVWFLEFSPAVCDYTEQPLELQIDVSGKQHRAIPDFGVRLLDGSRYLIEVKPAEKLRNPLIAERLQAVGKAAEKKGFKYLVVSEPILHQEPLLSNIRELIHHRPPRSDLMHYKELLTRLPREAISASTAATLVGGMMVLRKMQALHLIHMDLRISSSKPQHVIPYAGGRNEFLLH